MRKMNRRTGLSKGLLGTAAALMLGTALAVWAPPAAAYAQEAADTLVQEQRLNTWYSQAIQSINDNDFEHALLCLDGCMMYFTEESNPTLYADIYLKRGYCYFMLEKPQDALTALDEALETDPELANAILIKVNVYSNLEQYSEAAEQLERYIELTADDSMYETLSQLYDAAGEPEKAFDAYRTFADKTAADQAEADYTTALYSIQHGDYEKAVELLGQCIEADPPVDGAYYSRGLCYMALGDYDSAIADFAVSAEGETQAGDAMYNKGTCEMSLLKYEDAVASFTSCIEKEYQTENSRTNRGICSLLAGNTQEALDDFNESIENGANADEARFYRSLVYLSSKEYEAALADLTTCIENGYDLAGSYAQRAQVYKEMGDEEASAADLENARNAMKAADAAEEAPEESVTEAFEATTEEAAE